LKFILLKFLRKDENEIVYESPERTSKLYLELVKSQAETMADAFAWSVAKYGNKPIMGTREIIAELDEVQPNGKMFKKYDLGEYRWITYEDLDSTSDYFGRGLRSLGLEPRQKLCVFADTRAEWMITAQAGFKQAFPLVTLYTNLGEEAVVHGINQTQVNKIIYLYIY
jgi:long-chain acyl-CoA synthetase